MINVDEEFNIFIKTTGVSILDLSVTYRDLVSDELLNKIFITLIETIIRFRDIEADSMFNNGDFLDFLYHDILEDIMTFNNDNIDPDVLIMIEAEMISSILTPLEPMLEKTFKRLLKTKSKVAYFKNNNKIIKIGIPDE